MKSLRAGHHRASQFGQVLVFLGSLISVGGGNVGISQGVSPPSPITSSGLNTQVSQPVALPSGQTQYNITGGTRPGGGVNLFHSFGDFTVPNNNIANFLNDSGLTTSNILGRVTGGNISNIFGTIQTTGFGSANLFLMNPAGFLFGPNATLNVGGMVAFTTADYLRLADGVRFNAVPDVAADALLSMAPVAAYGFLGSNPGAITVQGSQLSVASGQSISLVGGNITIQSGTPNGGIAQPARLIAPSGTIQLGGAASPGEFDAATLQPLQNVANTSFTSFGSVTLAPGSNINISGQNTVSIRGGQFVLSVNDAVLNTADSFGAPETIVLSPGSSIISSNAGPAPGADIQIMAGNLQMDGASIQSTTKSNGSGGNISIGGQTVSLTNGAQIVSSTTGTGNGGSITVDAAESVTISGFDVDGTLNGVTTPFNFNPNTGLPVVTSGIYSTTSGTGTSGAISIIAPTVSLDNVAMVATIASGNGDGGNISIKASTVNITGEAALLSSAGLDFTTFNPSGSGRGGDITVSASDSVHVSGSNPDLGNFSQISSFTWNPTPNSGHGGSILISSPNITLDNVGTVSSTTQGSGVGGNISISSQNLALTGGTISTDSFDVGAGGNITLSASNALSVVNSFIQAFAHQNGKGGAINIAARSATVEGGTIRTTTFGAGPGGDIRVQVDKNLDVTGGGLIVTTSLNGSGSSGNVSITAGDTVTVSGTGQLDTATTSRIAANNPLGPSGSVDIRTGKFILTGNAMVESGSLARGRGRIAIQANDSVTLSEGSRIRMDVRDAPGGPINIIGDTITVDHASIRSRSPGVGTGGPIDLNASAVTITGGQVISDSVGGSARAGDITVNATDKVSISGQFTDEFGKISPAGVFSQALTGGTGGAISLTSPTITVSDGGQIASSTFFSGKAGSIMLNTNDLLISTGGQISSSSAISAPKVIPTGAGGIVTVQGQTPGSRADSILIDGVGSGIFTTTQGTGAGGSINILAQSLTLQNGGALSASTSGTASTATGGMITVKANQVQLDSGATITTATNGPGNAGNILVKADTLSMNGGATITASSTGSGNAGSVTIEGTASPAQSVLIYGAGSGVFTDTQGTGAGGNIFVNANSVTLQNGGTLSATTSGTATTAMGGSIALNATNQVTMAGGATITASSTGPADAGNIFINAGQQLRMNDSSITTEAARASGGNINIQAVGQVRLVNSTISTSVLGGSGSGGNITIDPTLISLQNSQILAQAVLGNGGNIQLITNLLLVDPTSVISASSEFGQSGTIQSPTSNLAGSVASLPSSVRQGQALQAQRCAVLAGGELSSFIIAGRDTVPAEPGGWALSAGEGSGARGYGAMVRGEGSAARSEGKDGAGSGYLAPDLSPLTPTPFIEDMSIVSLRRLTPVGFLTQRFAEGETGWCRT